MRKLLFRGLLPLFLLSSKPVSGGTQPHGIAPPRAFDYSPHPDVVEVLLVAHPTKARFVRGKPTRVYAYNGGTPGPTIEGKVGDTLVVHFLNRLPEATTIHWHGLDVPANMDGSHIAQLAVPPGGYFRYEFKLLKAALYWYHPHLNTKEQVEKGLQGALLVRPRHQRCRPSKNRLPQREHLLVLDDILLDENGQVAPAFPDDPLGNAERQVNGREGNHLLVNGRVCPKRWIQRGVPHRLRVVNVANSRMMRISIPGHTMWRVGGDGGLLEKPIRIEPIRMVADPDDPKERISDPDLSKGLILTPGERADLVFTPRWNGPLDLEWHDYARGRHAVFYMPNGMIGMGDAEDDGKRPPRKLMTFRLHGYGCHGDWRPPPKLRTIEPIDYKGASVLPVRFGHMMPDANGDVMFFAQMKNGMGLPFPKVTPADAPTVNVGDVRIVELWNMTGGDHNFHTHGFQFQPIELQYVDMDTPANNEVVPYGYLEDKDTILIPKRPGAKGRSRTVLRAAIVFDDRGRKGLIEAFGKKPTAKTSGGWVFHCHILEHAERGMMSFIQVRDP
jgi:FtsP/CotA-like multicopper oxidase with cupredoxin domain